YQARRRLVRGRAGPPPHRRHRRRPRPRRPYPHRLLRRRRAPHPRHLARPPRPRRSRPHPSQTSRPQPLRGRLAPQAGRRGEMGIFAGSFLLSCWLRTRGCIEGGGMGGSTPVVPGRVFMSYGGDDTDFPAAWLYERLTSHLGREQVFKDVDSIELGDDFVAMITSAVGSCDVLLALIGDRWLEMTNDTGT